MTTPNETRPPEGAFTIGGNGWRYGQEVSESFVSDMFAPANPANPAEALTAVKKVMEMAPPGALSGLAKIVPSLGDEDVTNDFGERVGEALNQKRPFKDLVDRIVSKLTGNDGVENSTLDDAQDAMSRLMADIAQNARSIQDLQARDAGEVATGSVVNIDFDQYPDGPIPPELFELDYLDDVHLTPGTATLGIENGLAQWVYRPGDGPRDARLIYPTPTDTHWQILRGTMAGPPMDPVAEGTPKFHALARVSEDRNTYVFARTWSVGSWFQYRGEIGIVIDGVETIWETDIHLTWSLDMTFIVGVGNNPHQYQVWSGAKLVKTYTDELEMCPLDEDNKYWGSIAQIRGKNHSGKIGGCSVADNQIPLTIGTNAMMYRITATPAMMIGGSTIQDFPDNFFELVGRTSSDIASDPEEGSFTVSKEGMYAIKCRVNLFSGMNSLATLALRVNGAVIDWSDGIWPSNGGDISGTFFQYLEEGDIVDMGYTKSGGNLLVLSGEATGTRTYFSITRIPDPLPLEPVIVEEEP